MSYVYMIKNSLKRIYVGVSDNPTSRLEQHNSGRGAKFTSKSDSFKIVFLEKYQSLSEARQREIQIKKWSRAKKEFLIQKYSLKEETRQ